MSLLLRGTSIVPRFTRDSNCCVSLRSLVLHQRVSIEHSQRSSFPQRNFFVSQLPSRSFATKAARKAKARKKSSNDSTPQSTPLRANAPVAAPSQTYIAPKDVYAHMLASKSSSTLLYSNIGNPEFTSFLAAMVGGYCIVYGISWVYDAALVYHPGLWRPINYMNGGVGIFMVGVGLSVLRRTRGQIGSIIAMPKRHANPPSLTLQVESRNSISLPLFWKRPVEWQPMMRPKVVDCSPGEVKLIDRISDVRNARGAVTGSDIQRRKDELLAQDPSGLKFFMDPLRRMYREFKRWMLKILVGDGFVNVQIQGKKFRMDVNSGWLLDDGQPLERLLNTK